MDLRTIQGREEKREFDLRKASERLRRKFGRSNSLKEKESWELEKSEGEEKEILQSRELGKIQEKEKELSLEITQETDGMYGRERWVLGIT